MGTRGQFITLEGGEGSGKSTQAKRLAADLARRGVEVVTTREPGGSPGAEAIRNLLVKGDTDRWDPVTEALLHFAARRDHLRVTVRPALDARRLGRVRPLRRQLDGLSGLGHGRGPAPASTPCSGSPPTG